MHEQSAVTSVLIGEALAHGDMGIAYAALAPGAVATAIGHWGSAEQQADLPARLHRRGRPRRGAGDPRAAAAVRPAEAGDHGAQGRRRVGARRRQVAGRPRRRVRALRRRRRGRGHRPGPLRGRVRGQGALGRTRAGNGPAARRHRPAAARGRAPSCRRAAGRGQARGLRRVRQPRTVRVVLARRRHRPGGTRLCNPLRQRAHRFRRTDLQPPGSRLRGRRHRHRERRDAPHRLPRGQPRRPGEDFSREAALARRLCSPRGWRSAPKACSCSAATASSRSTRSSAGTATSVQRA